MSARNTGLLVVDGELLSRCLGLPEGTVIASCLDGAFSRECVGGLSRVVLRIEHPSLPLVQEGNAIPVVIPVAEPDPIGGHPLFRKWGG